MKRMVSSLPIRGCVWRRMTSEQFAYYLHWKLEVFFVTDLHQMVDSVLSLKVSQGIPGGNGKSHSLVNLVRRLTYRCKRESTA